MMKATRRIPGSPALLAIGLIAALPSVGKAQLFPNQHIKREREACVQEPPFNAHVRRDYFGYYPTCWNRFPAGWACPCPNPELPNAAESFRLQPRDKPTGLEPGDAPEPEDPGMPGDLPDDPKLPPMPNQGRSPFELDPKPGVANPLDTPPGGPLRNPNDPAPAPSPSIDAPTTPIPAPTGLQEMPKAPSPTTGFVEPGSMTLPPLDEAALASSSIGNDEMPVQANLGPLPSPRAVATGPAVLDAEPMVGAKPAQAPARKGVLGGLFNIGNRRRR